MNAPKRDKRKNQREINPNRHLLSISQDFCRATHTYVNTEHAVKWVFGYKLTAITPEKPNHIKAANILFKSFSLYILWRFSFDVPFYARKYWLGSAEILRECI